MNFVYPHGSTLNVLKPAVPVLSTGQLAYPLNRPIAAFWGKKGGPSGRLAVLGSPQLFGDNFLEEEENSKLQDVIFKWLFGEFQLDQIDSESPDLAEYHYVPNTEELSERLRSCLQETEELPKDHTLLFDDTLFKIDTSQIPEIVHLYEVIFIIHVFHRQSNSI